MKMLHSVLLIIACCFVTGVATYQISKALTEKKLDEKYNSQFEFACSYRDALIEVQRGEIDRMKYFLLHPDEYDILCRTVSGESGGQSQKCQQLVAETIINKAGPLHISRGSSIRNTVYAPGAFDVADSLNKYEPNERTLEACLVAVQSDNRINALYFCSETVDDTTFEKCFAEDLVKITTVDGMKFWRLKE